MCMILTSKMLHNSQKAYLPQCIFLGALCENSATFGIPTIQSSTLPSPQTSISRAPQISTLIPKNVSASTSSLSPTDYTRTPQVNMDSSTLPSPQTSISRAPQISTSIPKI